MGNGLVSIRLFLFLIWNHGDIGQEYCELSLRDPLDKIGSFLQ